MVEGEKRKVLSSGRKATVLGNNERKGFLKKPVTGAQWLGYGVITVVLLGLLAFGLYGVSEFKDGRFAWMKHDDTRIFSRLFKKVSAPEVEDYVIERMVPIHDDNKSRIGEFKSDIERQCYLAFSGSICGFGREAKRARISVERLINLEGRVEGEEDVDNCAKGTKRYRDEMEGIRAGTPHCLTVQDIVRDLME